VGRGHTHGGWDSIKEMRGSPNSGGGDRKIIFPHKGPGRRNVVPIGGNRQPPGKPNCEKPKSKGRPTGEKVVPP